MDKELVKKFEGELQKEKLHLEGAIKELSEAVDFGSDQDHLDEEADETEELSNRVGQRATFEERLNRVNEAISRIADGVYGVCAGCGKEIERQVLEASPESTLCKSCKAK